jgi:hypothetical protein
MTEEAFRAKRRQPFLTEKYFKLNLHALNHLIQVSLDAIPPRKAAGDFDSFGEGGVFKDKMNLLRLHYTAGEPIETLRPLYADAMKWFAAWHEAEEKYLAHISEGDLEPIRLDTSPLQFEDLCHFQLALDVVSLGVLLGEGDAVRHAAKLMDSSRGSDMLFEAIVERAAIDPRDVDEFFHVKPYDPLLDAIYSADTPQQASAFVKTYLEGWYKSFEGAPWHNGHTEANEEYMPYEGYWAFEAAAVCVLYGIDDSSFRDHLVYPKDLADWARKNDVVNRIKPDAPTPTNGAAERLRCEPGQPCPREGWWLTPAKQGSRRHFQQGEVMPEMHSDTWATVWQWDESQ